MGVGGGLERERPAAREALVQADEKKDLAEGRLGRVYVENGLRAARLDLGAALLWFAEAVQQCGAKLPPCWGDQPLHPIYGPE